VSGLRARTLEASGGLLAAERESAVQLLARAFRDNPLNVAVIGSHDPALRLRVNAHGLRSLLPTAHSHGRVRVQRVGGELAGVLIAAPPDAFPLPAASLARRLRSSFGQGLRVARRWADVFEALAPLHPPEPHWYLSTLGVDPREQRRGLGGALLADWLAEVDRDASCAYLETDRPENVAFYERAGFAVLGETQIFSVPVWRMRRPDMSAPGVSAPGVSGPDVSGAGAGARH
jgi:ribosomal protein S18 acetylase RimI-like enzyme